jgi:esterase/lipase
VRTFGALQPERLRRLKRIRPNSYHPGPPEFDAYIRQQQAARGEPVSGRVRYTRWPTAAVEQLARLLIVVHQRLPEVVAPALLIYSENDQTVAPLHLQIARERLTGAPVESLLLAQSGHILTQDIEMATVFARVADFVERAAGQPPSGMRSAG